MTNNVDNYMYQTSRENLQVLANDKKVYLITKKIIDVIGALILIFLLLPIFLLVALAIKIEDPKGSIIFSQNRIGLNGKEFKMFKFRSMFENAEERLHIVLKHNEVEGAMFKIKDDPRITKVGKFIRKTSIDELPQLLNVLIGDMSLVGPRPPLHREVAMYTDYDMQRLLVVPGCTGLWQVSGRNSLGFSEMVELDLEYIQKRNIFFDFYILYRTVWVVLNSENAY